MKKIRFLREFTARRSMGAAGQLLSEIKPDEEMAQARLSVISESSVFAVGDEVEGSPMTVERQLRSVVAITDRRIGTILDDVVEGTDFAVIKPTS